MKIADLPKGLKKSAILTDIHFGKKSNSELHNQDCLRFIDWFCEQVKADPSIDHVSFLGDWHENRGSLNISTLKYSYEGAKKLNELGIPILFVTGNHDLFHRHTREVHSIVHFEQFENFIIIDQPVVVEQIGNGGAVYSPFLFHHEYPDLGNYLQYETWFGHFEFQGFVVTGYNITMPTGPDPRDYIGPKHIVSGHFHKRQVWENIVYIGNTFPMDFSDAGDNERGMAIYDHTRNDMEFINWEDCPKYTKTTVSNLLDERVVIYPDSRVKCIADISISYEESNLIRSTYIDKYKLREFVIEESQDLADALSGTEVSVDLENMELANINDLMIQMLSDIDSEHIDNNLLIELYKNIK